VQAIRDSGLVPRRAIEIVAWMNEEGSRFAPGMMGSAAFAGDMTLAEVLPVRDADGVTVEQGLADMARAFPDVPRRALGRSVAAYVEAHIEQGPVLEKQGFSVGVVTGIQGKRTFRVSVTGDDAHAGTAALRDRKDALLSATAMIQALSAAMHDDDDIVKFTVGRLEVRPNAPSVVAGHAQFSIDLRHPVEARLRELGDRVAAVCRDKAGPCDLSVEELVTAWPLEFPAGMQAEVRDAAARLGLRSMDLPSAAGHDARYLHGVCPSAMIFVPCKDGISHNEAESATPGDLYDGARVLAETLAALAER
jgi:N-carbamoyl-L-amino-acid hydrolase